MLDGRQDIASFPGPGNNCMTLHSDLFSAKDTISKLRTLERDYGAHIALAHDASWLEKGTDEVLMSLLDEKMKLAAKEKIPRDEIP